jgi:hypothetical protein
MSVLIAINDKVEATIILELICNTYNQCAREVTLEWGVISDVLCPKFGLPFILYKRLGGNILLYTI